MPTENFFSKKDPFALRKAFEALVEIKEHYERIIGEQNSALEALNIKFQPVYNVETKVPNLSHFTETETYFGRKFLTVEVAEQKFSEWRSNIMTEIARVEEKNKPIEQHNQNVRNSVIKLMTAIGIPAQTTRSYYKTNRSSKMTTEVTPAGYTIDLQSAMPRSDVLSVKYAVKNLETYFDNWKKSRQVEEEKLKIEQENKKRATLDMMFRDVNLRTAIERVGLKDDFTSLVLCSNMSVEDKISEVNNLVERATSILESRNKYLSLAHAMSSVRNDWSEGPDSVEYALDALPLENDVDNQIYDELRLILDNFEDGRSFRDCEWNYSVLFGMCNEEDLDTYNMLEAFKADHD